MRTTIAAILLGIFFAVIAVKTIIKIPTLNTHITRWNIQSIDTMKFSRDLAREKLNDKNFPNIIDTQVSLIAKTGATHIAIATPYDEEFIPILSQWVRAARKYKLKVWFRGNLAGWEGWFEYSKIDRKTHSQNIEKFIVSNSGLFEDGDVFASCPECENGGPGDPRQTGDIEGHRKFLIDEYQMTSSAFKKIKKVVVSNFNSMNYDVAKVIMDKNTTEKLGGIIVVDQYVSSPDKTVTDLEELSKETNGLIVLGEVGAPIPDIQGEMTDSQQNEWIAQLFKKLSESNKIIGINYWTGFGSSTEIWNAEYKPHLAVHTISTFFNPPLAP